MLENITKKRCKTADFKLNSSKRNTEYMQEMQQPNVN